MLVGRRLAIGTLRSAVDAAAGGAGGVVLLAGEAGMGKTALASGAVAYAKTRGATAVWGTCWEGDGAPGFWPWIQVVRALDPGDGDAGRGEREGMLAELTGVTEDRGGVLGDESAIRFRIPGMPGDDFPPQSGVPAAGGRSDDLHWADLSSLRLLVFLARQLHDAAVLVIGTYRDVEVAATDHPARPLLAEVAGQAELIQLTGLTPAETGQLIEKVCGERPQARLIQAVHDRTAGNPFFAQQIARLLAAQDAPLDRALVTGVPPAVGDVLARRLARLPGAVVDLLAVASVAGRRFPVATAAALAGVTAGTAVPLLDRAVRAAVLEQDEPGYLRFSHDLFRDVLYQGLPAAGPGALGGPAGRRAGPPTCGNRLSRKAWPPGTVTTVAPHRAAREATAGPPSTSAPLPPPVGSAGGTGASAAILCEYGDALRRAGHGDEAQTILTEAAVRARTAGDTALFARAAFGAHRVAAATESPRSAVIALLEEALAALGAAPAPAPQAAAVAADAAGEDSLTALTPIFTRRRAAPRWTADGRCGGVLATR
jgi:hypothetical protein